MAVQGSSYRQLGSQYVPIFSTSELAFLGNIARVGAVVYDRLPISLSYPLFSGLYHGIWILIGALPLIGVVASLKITSVALAALVLFGLQVFVFCTLCRGTVEQVNFLLLASSREGNLQGVTFALAAGASCENSSPPRDSALTVAIEGGHTEVVQTLLASGASVNHQDANGWTPLMQAVTSTDTEILRILLDRGGDINLALEDGTTALMEAARCGNRDGIQILLDTRADVNQVNRFGWTALMHAASTGQVAAVQALLLRQAEINHIGAGRTTALMLASERGYLRVVQQLLFHGADEKIVDVSGDTALVLAYQSGDSVDNRLQVMEALLQRGGSVANFIDPTQRSILMCAVIDDKPIEEVELLVRYISHTYVDPLGLTALDHALQNIRLQHVTVLVAHGARLRVGFTVQEYVEECGWEFTTDQISALGRAYRRGIRQSVRREGRCET